MVVPDRRYMLTAGAILELDFEQPCLDYLSLMQLTKILTRDHKPDLENMFRRMCFNVSRIIVMTTQRILHFCMMKKRIVGGLRLLTT